MLLFELFFTINNITFVTLQYNYFNEDKKTAMASALSSIGSLSIFLAFYDSRGIFRKCKIFNIFRANVFICSILIIFLANKLENVK